MTGKAADYTDEDILKLFRTEDRKDYAFNILVRKYQERLYWHVRRILIGHDDTDDILQNTFIKAWSGLDKFREASAIYTWLYRIATNEALAFLKKKKRKYLLPVTDVEKQLSSKIETDEYFDGDELQLKLQKAVLSLPGKQRVVFNMKYFDEMKYEEIAAIMNTSVGALKASFHHAVKKIEKYLTEH
ncbi:MAG: sigma-70 family RNA polymerase sigma factor [Bacteroidales bacterium]|nr:sigma-70 family RNA polymerase sigma factor [Bacteroidales bacterium]